jgi:hypothetical protein
VLGGNMDTLSYEISHFLTDQSIPRRKVTTETCFADAYDAVGNLYGGNQDQSLTVVAQNGPQTLVPNLGSPLLWQSITPEDIFTSPIQSGTASLSTTPAERCTRLPIRAPHSSIGGAPSTCLSDCLSGLPSPSGTPSISAEVGATPGANEA